METAVSSIAPYGRVTREEINKKHNAARAWLLDLGSNHWAAVPLHEMSQVLLMPELFTVPLTPAHCYQILLFQRRILPVINVSALVSGEITEVSDGKIVGMTVYQKAPKTPLLYAGIHLANLPSMIYVEDTQITTLPTQEPLWSLFSMSCILHEDRKIPILDLPALYSAAVALQVS